MKHIQVGLTNEDCLTMYETMLLARKLDERMWLLNRSGKIPFVISCQGQEGAQVGASFAFDTTKDYVAPYYRDLAIVLHFGMTPTEVMLNAFAKADDPNSGGRQMPAHFGHKRLRILSGSSPVTTQVPHAAGVALSTVIDGQDAVTLVTLGEGSSNQGDFHEGANFAAVHKLPMIIMVENNQYAISVPISKQVACEKISDRAMGYGMPGETVDGKDPIAVYEVMKQAVDRARNGKGPSLIEVLTTRLTAHSSDDDQKQYRTAEDLTAGKEQDPIPYFANYLLENDVATAEQLSELAERVQQRVNEATDIAEAAPYASDEHLFNYVYAKGDDV
jgi:2-oxoisovalerate dehydrogenase E1 component alpha subunit